MAFWIALHQLKHKGFACLMKHQGPCCSALWHSSEVFTHKALCSLDTTNEGTNQGGNISLTATTSAKSRAPLKQCPRRLHLRLLFYPRTLSVFL
jgi:hypothetical protein